MANIQVLDQHTIDKIAAGEVIERPASVVKELVENAVDAGATAVTVEIKEGGTTFLRVTDNGSGIEGDQVPLAFLRHSTSKIRKVEDLLNVSSLGFRGEALSSIAAVSMVELITKTKDRDAGIRYVIEGGKEKELEEIAAPNGTTFLIRSLFYNTPARRKFLKSPMTEGSYIGDLMERMALSRPDISFKFINNGQTRLHTSGNHNLKDVIYQIYGREIAANLIPIDRKEGPIHLTGYIGKPIIGRGNRNFETYFVNGRYVKSNILAKGIEDAYKTLLMQHKYPFTVLHFAVDGEYLDVNVHPTKMELRFSNQEQVYRFLQETVRNALLGIELIPQVSLGPETKDEPVEEKTAETKPAEVKTAVMPEKPAPSAPREHNLDYFLEEMRKRVAKAHEKPQPVVREQKAAYGGNEPKSQPKPEVKIEPKPQPKPEVKIEPKTQPKPEVKVELKPQPKPEVAAELKPQQAESPKVQETKVQELKVQEPEQLELFERELLNPNTKADIRIIGQLFDTYQLVQFQDKFYMIDQHAAHEKVLFEEMMDSLRKKEIVSQMVSPPLIVTLNPVEAEVLSIYKDAFAELGFEVEPFGGKEYAISAVPSNLYGIAERELFLEMLDSLSESMTGGRSDSQLILEKIASMSCKAAVKGNQRISRMEAEALVEKLFTLENPYTCPHGRPTIISMTKQEIERKFKRIV